MTTIILIIQPPALRDTPTFETQFYTQCVSNLSELIGKNKGSQILTENVFQIAGDDAPSIFGDAVRILPEGTQYSYTTLTEEPRWQSKEKSKA